MHYIPISTAIIVRPSSRRRSIIGGGRRIECSTSWKWHAFIPVSHDRNPNQICLTYSGNPILGSGLVLFLEEDHYVAEDFLYLLAMMQQRTKDLCPQCNILSLGTYLKTFNYYTYHSKVRADLVHNYASHLSVLLCLGYEIVVSRLVAQQQQPQQQQTKAASKTNILISFIYFLFINKKTKTKTKQFSTLMPI